MIAKERIQTLNTNGIADRPYVIYWMQAAQRAECNHALEYALRQANLQHKPLLVYFGITEDFPEANARHYRFMLQGLREVKAELENRKIRMIIRNISPGAGALELAALAAMMVVDKGTLRVERAWRALLADSAPCTVIQVETNVIVPVETASGKEEYAARTLRPKISRLLGAFALPLEEHSVNIPSASVRLPFEEFAVEDMDAALRRLKTDSSVKPAYGFVGGTSRAKALLRDFIANKLTRYLELKNDPGLDYSSNLSPYLHFGQISPLFVYQSLQKGSDENTKAFTEELVVRRELSMNFVHYNDRYDSYLSVPAWARATLEKHRADPRAYRYSIQELEEGKTHDPYWNAAQKEMVLTGKMNGYMRMYWGKKILEWGSTPEEAYQAAIFLNNRYSLDGRDPNAYAGTAWCFGKHDRPWKEREIFGTVRYMNAKGLDRKFDMQRYMEKVGRIASGKEQADGN